MKILIAMILIIGLLISFPSISVENYYGRILDIDQDTYYTWFYIQFEEDYFVCNLQDGEEYLACYKTRPLSFR